MGIRKANIESDLAALIRIEKSCFNPGFSGSCFFYFIKSESSPLYVYEEDSGLEGYCLCTQNAELGEVWIASLAVRPESQGQGIGSSLVKHALHSNAARSIYLTCQGTKPSLIAFYEKLGFAKYNTLSDPYKEGLDRALLKFSPPGYK